MPIDVLRRRCAPWPLVASLACWAPLSAHAAIEPYYVGASQSLTADTNIYKVPEQQAATRDLIATTSVYGGFDQRLSRWQLTAHGALLASRYANTSSLDNDGYNLNLGLQGDTAEHLSGGVRYVTNRSLTSFANSRDPQAQERNMETLEQFVLQGQLGGGGQFAADASYTHRGLDYSAEQFRARDSTQKVGATGFVWTPSPDLRWRLGWRYTDGNFPQGLQTAPGVYAPDSFERHDTDLSVNLRATGASTLSLRISNTRQDYDRGSLRNFAGLTGALDWDWQATGKTHLRLTLNRDTGSETTFYQFAGQYGGATGDFNQLSAIATLSLTHQLTGKLNLDAGWSQVHRKLASNAVAGNAVLSQIAGGDDTQNLSLGLRYAITRTVGASCSAHYEKRTATGVLSHPYDVSRGVCQVSLTLR